MRNMLASLLLALSLGSALAQTRDSHAVSVHVPQVLRLRIGGETATGRATTAIGIRVSDGTYRIDPSGTEVQVLANSNWQLTTRYVPASDGDAAARLVWQLENGGWQAFSDFDQLVTSGSPTGGWRSLRLSYGLDTPLPPDGDYQGVITYTLARP